MSQAVHWGALTPHTYSSMQTVLHPPAGQNPTTHRDSTAATETQNKLYSRSPERKKERRKKIPRYFPEISIASSERTRPPWLSLKIERSEQRVYRSSVAVETTGRTLERGVVHYRG